MLMQPPKIYSHLTHIETLAPIFSQDLSLPDSVLKQILGLPRASLVQDLEEILTHLPGLAENPPQVDLGENPPEVDLGENPPQVELGENPPQVELAKRSFVIHTLNLLAELQARESIPVIEVFLKLPEDELHHWLGAYPELGLWEVLFDLYRNLHPELGVLLLQQSLAEAIRIPLLNALAQIAWHLPVYRQPVLKTFENLMDAALEETLPVSPAFVGELVRETTDLRAEKLLPKIRELFAAGMVQSEIAGNFQAVEAGMTGPVRSHAKRPDRNIYERYEFYRSQHRLSTQENPDTAVRLDLPKPPKPGRGHLRSLERKKQPLRKGTKVGRNQACPCGSGKKYKHCHGK